MLGEVVSSVYIWLVQLIILICIFLQKLKGFPHHNSTHIYVKFQCQNRMFS